ncbi:MAG: fused response regulator/phosphatase [Deltaproteobacteria bacterium]|nr:fused response regulator/phosphatase [Deltaproteobacteria bacterium]
MKSTQKQEKLRPVMKPGFKPVSTTLQEPAAKVQPDFEKDKNPFADIPPTLLVVDDDPDILRVVKFYLIKQEYNVLTASCGEEALAILAKNQDVELVLSDVMMPNMSGLELLKEIRSHEVHMDTPVILISAEGETSKKVTGLNLGADDFITKPFNFDELMARVKNHIRLRRLQKEVLLANKIAMEANSKLQQQHDRLLEDLESARSVQMALLPSEYPAHDGFKVGACYLPAERVGGDLFDVVQLNGGRKMGVLIVDVCGHGVAAAFITAMTKLSFQNACRRSLDPSVVLSKMNNELMENIHDGYVTAFYAVYDYDTHELAYASGGHPPIKIYRPGQKDLITLESQATFLGIFPDVEYTTDVFQAQPGDRIFFYTDGLYESQNIEGEPFGMERVASRIRNSDGQEIQTCLDMLLKDLVDHVEGVAFDDDITMVGLDIMA